MNEAVLRHLAGKKKLKTKRLKVDTTVTESTIAYPTDTGLLYRGIRKIGQLVGKLQENGLAGARSFVDHSRKAKELYREVVRTVRERSGEAGAKLRPVLTGLATLAEDTLRQAGKVIHAAKEALAKGGRTVKSTLLHDLEVFHATLGWVTVQAWQQLAGVKT